MSNRGKLRVIAVATTAALLGSSMVVTGAAQATAAPATPAAASRYPQIRFDVTETSIGVAVAPFTRVGRSARLRLLALHGSTTFFRGEQQLGARHRFAVPDLGGADTGLVAQIVEDGTVVHSQFRAVRRHRGEFVTATSLAQLDRAVLRADRRSGAISAGELARREADLHRAGGSPGMRVRPTAGPTLTATTTVSGYTRYLDRSGTQRPIRSAPVRLAQVTGSGYQVYGAADTDANGAFTISTTVLIPDGQYVVWVVASNVNGEVRDADTGTPYTAYSVELPLSPGDTRSGVVIDVDQVTETGRAFALFDAVHTVGAFYQTIRKSGWSADLSVTYPSGTNRSYAVGGWIFISGGETQCGSDWCSEDAFDWDVLAHEAGHVVASSAGITDSPGGTHVVCDPLWSGSRSKNDAVKLAWAEGFATFFGVAAQRIQGVPPGMAHAGDESYDDRPGPPHNTPGSLSFSLQTPPCTNSSGEITGGDDAEDAVAGALYDFWDGGGADDDGVSWSFTDILNRLDNANATMFTTARDALFANRTRADLIGAANILSVWRFAPALTSPTGTVVSATPVPLRWAPQGMELHPNQQFTLTIADAVSQAVIVSTTTSQTEYTPSQTAWNQIAQAGDVLITIAGTESTSPATTYSAQHLLPIGGIPSVPRLMVVGDSISHGIEADYTWRYRLKQHLQGLGQAVDFVGPYTGTSRLTTTPGVSFTGGYGPTNFSFDSQHLAQWGSQAAQAKNAILSRVIEYQPDYLLVELGFNDIGWFVSSPDGLIVDMGTFIANARLAKPDVKILVANVAHRTPLGAVNPDLNAKISTYNTLLGPAVAGWDTATSPVRLVDISTDYDPYADAYDGLHPNSVGEYKIARAFANVLAGQFGLGSTFGSIPTMPEEFHPAAPTWLDATATDGGVHVEWQHSYGAAGYTLYSRNVTVGQSFGASPVATDDIDISWVMTGNTYEYYVVPVRGAYVGAPSPTDSVVADPKTSTGPTNIIVTPISGAIDLSWTPPAGPYSATVTGYKVSYMDQSDPDAWMQVHDVPGATSYRITGLVDGHTYIIAVSSVNASGEGWPSVAARARPGMGMPSTPTLTQARITGPTDIHVVWTPVPQAADYVIVAHYAEPMRYGVGAGTSADIGYLWPGAGNYTYCAIAINGSLESPESNCIQGTLDTPTLLSARALSRTDIRLSWTAVPGATAYRIMSRNVLNGPTFGNHGETSDTTHEIGWLFPGVGYWEWCVIGLTPGTQSQQSNCLRTQVDPPVLTRALMLTATDVRLEWTASPGTSNYHIYSRDVVANPTGPFNHVGSTAATSHEIGWLFPGSWRWEWYIVAEADGAFSPQSNVLRSHS